MENIKAVFCYKHHENLRLEVFDLDDNCERFQYEKQNGIWVPFLSDFDLDCQKRYYLWHAINNLSNFGSEESYLENWKNGYFEKAEKLMKKYRTKLLFSDISGKLETLYEKKNTII